MECRHGNFWIGLGIGSILGAVAYRLSRTAKAKQLESEIYNAIHRIGRDAEIAADHDVADDLAADGGRDLPQLLVPLDDLAQDGHDALAVRRERNALVAALQNGE